MGSKKKNDAQASIFLTNFEAFQWISDEILLLVFDILRER